MRRLKVLVVIPAYNEEESVASVIEEIRLINKEYDIVVVDDGSTDRTFEKASSMGVTILRLPINLGIGAAVQTGFQYALRRDYDVVVQVDADGQHDPRFIADLVQPIESSQADAVIGSRFLGGLGYRSTWPRRLGIVIFSIVNSSIVGQRITDNTSGFRAYSRKAFGYLAECYPSDYPEPETIILLGKRKFRMLEKPVEMRRRMGGRSSISTAKSIYYMVKVLLSIGVDLLKTNKEEQQ